MVNLTNDEWVDAMKGLSEPSPAATEYGHRGIITSRARYNEKTQAEADAWIASAPVSDPKETR